MSTQPQIPPRAQIVVDALGALEGSLRLLHQLGRPLTYRELADAVHDVASAVAAGTPTPESEFIDDEQPRGEPRWRSCRCEGADPDCPECEGTGITF